MHSTKCIHGGLYIHGTIWHVTSSVPIHTTLDKAHLGRTAVVHLRSEELECSGSEDCSGKPMKAISAPVTELFP